MLIAQGSPTHPISPDDARQLLARAFDPLPLDGKRVLVIIPDGTRTAPIPLLFRLLHEQLGRRVAALDYLIALGTHPPMADAAIARRVGVPADERAARYPGVRIFNHTWNQPGTLEAFGVISSEEVARLTDGLLAVETPVRLNRRILDYDHLVICGPVYPHEVVGFSGGAKYLFPGIAGAEIIDVTHWLSALRTNLQTIGVKDTPVRRIIHRAAEFVPRPITCIALAVRSGGAGADEPGGTAPSAATASPPLFGLYVGSHLEAWSAAADLSAQLNIRIVPHAFQQVLSAPSEMYYELWTASKAMYKTEPAVADGGEIILYAPHLTEVSQAHGHLLRRVGYHVRDYFLKQWDQFATVPWAVLAHASHLRGSGTYEDGVERPRVQVTLATGIPPDVCREINLGYRDPASVRPAEWTSRESEGRLYVPHAGEYLYRVRDA